MTSDVIWWLLRIAEFIALAYFMLIAVYTIGWYRLKECPTLEKSQNIRTSVLVATRNEEANILSLIRSLSQQDYPKSLTQIVIIDDHSEDDTVEKVNSFSKLFPDLDIQLILAEGFGKKAALSEALAIVNGDLILVTDADCLPPPFWISQMTACYLEGGYKMLLGPVLLDPAKSLFYRLQVLEFISLMGSTAGASGAGLPVMGNGANMAFDRKAALLAGNLDVSGQFASGDDVFMLFSFIKKFGRKTIHFVNSEAAIVTTLPTSDFSAFLQQRMRWVSKSRGYKNPVIIVPALIVFLFNLMLVVLIFSSVIYPFMLLVYVLFLLLKYLIDYPLLHATSGFMRRRNLLKYALPLELIYPFYVVGIGIMGNIFKVRWKGRQMQRGKIINPL